MRLITLAENFVYTILTSPVLSLAGEIEDDQKRFA
jgi:hypothetical protein